MHDLQLYYNVKEGSINTVIDKNKTGSPPSSGNEPASPRRKKLITDILSNPDSITQKSRKALDRFHEGRLTRKTLELIFNKAPTSIFLATYENGEFYYVEGNETFYSRNKLDPAAVRGLKIDDHLNAEDAEKVKRHMYQCLETRQRKVVQEKVRLAIGERWVELSYEPLFEEGEDPQILGIVTDITDLKAQQQQLTNQASESETLAEIGNIALQQNTIESFFEKSCEIISKLMNIEFVKIGILSEDLTQLQIVAGRGWKEDVVNAYCMSVYENTQSSYSLQTSDPILVADADQENRFEYSRLQEMHDIKSGITIIINGLSGPYAILGVHSREKHFFQEEDLAFYRSLAKHMGSCVKHYQSQQALKRSEQLVLSILKSAGIGIIVCDTQGRMTRANDELAKITGYSLSDLTGRHLNMLYAWDRKEERRRVFEDYFLRADGPLIIEDELQSKDGRRIEVAIKAMPVRGDWKERPFIFTVTDITAQKQSERQLKLLELAATYAGDGILILNNKRDLPGPEIIYTNPAFCTLTGYSNDEVLGQPLTFLEGQDTNTGDLLRIQKSFKTGQSFKTDIQYLKKNGESTWIQLSLIPVRRGEEDNKIAHWLAILHDINDRKRQESALREEKEIADTRSKAKTNFLAEVSHEIRTPLNAIIGFAEILKNEYFGSMENQKYLEYAAHIYESGEFLMDLINGVLDLSKIEAGEVELNEEVFDMQGICENVIKLLSQRAEKGGISLNLPKLNAYPHIKADPIKIKQVLINLVTNAIKFTPSGGRVTVTSFILGNGSYEFAVEDTGVGIAAHELEKALAPYKNCDINLLKKNTGSGLGLPVSKTLVELHGGLFELESEVGRGTTVRAILPAGRVITAKE